MSHVKTSTILNNAKKRKYGIPCFLSGNMEMLMGQVVAANLRKAPIIITYNIGLMNRFPLECFASSMVRAAEYVDVPVATILDHCNDFDVIEKAMRVGLKCVMYDGSELPFDENVRNTREVVKMAKHYDVCVEAELGKVGGTVENIDLYRTECSEYTDAGLAKKFVELTGIDQLAISCGNVHGQYMNDHAGIQYDLIEKINSMVDVPLVMHGSSGLTDNEYKKIIRAGIQKFNYYTTMGLSGIESIKNYLNVSCPNSVYHDLIKHTYEFFIDFSCKVIDLLECDNKVAQIDLSEEGCGEIPDMVKIIMKNYK